MANKPKPPVAEWLITQRKARGDAVEDTARVTDRSAATVRGWEAGRPPSADDPVIVVLESYYGSIAPRDEPADDRALVTAIGELVTQMKTLVGLATDREARIATLEAASQSNSELLGRLLEQVLQAETRLSALERTEE